MQALLSKDIPLNEILPAEAFPQQGVQGGGFAL